MSENHYLSKLKKVLFPNHCVGPACDGRSNFIPFAIRALRNAAIQIIIIIINLYAQLKIFIYSGEKNNLGDNSKNTKHRAFELPDNRLCMLPCKGVDNYN